MLRSNLLCFGAWKKTLIFFFIYIHKGGFVFNIFFFPYMTKKQQEEEEIDSVNITVLLKISLSLSLSPSVSRPALMGGSVHGSAAES